MRNRLNNKRNKAQRKYEGVVVNTCNCQYPIIPTVIQSLGWTSTKSDSKHWDIAWSDRSRGVDDLVRKSMYYQKMNHFPGMNEIYTKSNLAKTLQGMQLINKSEYSYFPSTWELPQCYSEVAKYYNTNGSNACLIIKPKSGAKGEGIYLSRSIDSVHREYEYIAQEYIPNPLLIDGYKFDLRIYALIISCNPLRIFIYKDGLVRLCTELYQAPTDENIECTYMHLTNYALNKENEKFIPNDLQNENQSSKRSLTWFWTWLKDNHHQQQYPQTSNNSNHATNVNNNGSADNMSNNNNSNNNNISDEDDVCAQVWSSIADIIVKTLIAVQPILSESVANAKVHSSNKNPFTCFELLGFDILLTTDLRPYLLEVNHSPSFHCDSILDYNTKFHLIQDTLKLLNVNSQEKNLFIKKTLEKTQDRLYGDTCSTSTTNTNSTSSSSSSFSSSSSASRSTTNNIEDSNNANTNNTQCNNNNNISWHQYFKDLTSLNSWKTHLLAEPENLRHSRYELIYPTNTYPHQPTAASSRVVLGGVGVDPQEKYDLLIRQTHQQYNFKRQSPRNSGSSSGSVSKNKTNSSSHSSLNRGMGLYIPVLLVQTTPRLDDSGNCHITVNNIAKDVGYSQANQISFSGLRINDRNIQNTSSNTNINYNSLERVIVASKVIHLPSVVGIAGITTAVDDVDNNTNKNYNNNNNNNTNKSYNNNNDDDDNNNNDNNNTTNNNCDFATNSSLVVSIRDNSAWKQLLDVVMPSSSSVPFHSDSTTANISQLFSPTPPSSLATTGSVELKSSVCSTSSSSSPSVSVAPSSPSRASKFMLSHQQQQRSHPHYEHQQEVSVPTATTTITTSPSLTRRKGFSFPINNLHLSRTLNDTSVVKLPDASTSSSSSLRLDLKAFCKEYSKFKKENKNSVNNNSNNNNIENNNLISTSTSARS